MSIKSLATMMKRKVFVALFGFVSMLAMGQQDAQYTQYMYNTLSINPAYAGSREVFSSNALYRSQWVGLDGAPETQTFNVHAPIKERLGLGLSIINDRLGNGTNQETQFHFMAAYHIPVSSEGKLAFGVNFGGSILNIDFSRLRLFDASSSLALQTAIDNKFSPNFGTGAYYYTQNFYIGASVPNILETRYFDESDNAGVGFERMNAYLMSGVVVNLALDWKMKPAVLLKAVSGAPVQTDLSLNFLYAEKFTFGGAYRFGAAWSALGAYQINPSVMIGLAYDTEITELGNTAFNNGSFEIFLRFEPQTWLESMLYKSPRFF